MINKINKPLSRLNKEREREGKYINIRNKRGDITTGLMDVKMVVKECYEQLHALKFYRLNKMVLSFERQTLPKSHLQN